MREFKKKLNNNSGFTLVEVLLSMLILSIIVTSATVAFVYATKTSRDNKLEMTAMSLANDSVEYIRSLEFADIGTKTIVGGTEVFGDPKGDILQSTTKVVDGVEYTIKTSINWETRGSWDLGDIDWDYKSIRITVYPTSRVGDTILTKVIETYITRDSSQPALTGANISVRLIRGWNYSAGTKSPVSNVRVLLSSGPSAPRQVQTSSGGVSSFLDLLPGGYTVTVDPSNLGMMLQPNLAADWTSTISDGITQRKEFQVEYPCSLKITLKDLAGSPIGLTGGESGSIKISVPYGTEINKTFTSADMDAQGKLPDNYITGLWPVGSGYSGAYTVQDITIPECQFMGAYELSGPGETMWTGTFDGPGTVKNITCYIGTIPETPSGITTNWINGSGSILTTSGSYTAWDEEEENILNGKFYTSDPEDTIYMPYGKTVHYNANSVYFENTGTVTEPGLYINKKSNLILHSGKVVFRGSIAMQEAGNPGDKGKITLSTYYEDSTQIASCVDGSLIGATDGIYYGRIYFTKPFEIDDHTTIEPGGYYFYNGLELPNNSADLIKITKENYIN